MHNMKKEVFEIDNSNFKRSFDESEGKMKVTLLLVL